MANPFRAALTRSTPRAVDGTNTYSGGQHSRLTSDWVFATIQSADQEVRAGLRTLRARARELVRNNDTASRFCSLVDEQAIGPQGIRFQAHVTRADGMLDLGINGRIEDAFEEWCEPGNCTLDGRLGFADVQSLIAQTLPSDGEVLIRMTPTKANRFAMALELIDPDLLDHEFNREAGQGGAEIRMGVEIDAAGRRLAYWLWDHHPSEYTGRGRERRRIPASDVIHLGRGTRIGQTRFLPWFTPALLKLRHLGGYEEAELVAARVAAAKGGFFTRPADAASADPNAPNADTNLQWNYPVEAGVFDALPPGWAFAEWDPKHPTDAFADFHKSMLRGIANGLNVSYVSLANDLTDVNFSSIRAGLLNERDAWRKLQWWLVRHFLRPVYRRWLNWALTTGALELPLRNRERWAAHRWQPRGWPWVDPEKDINAAAKEVAMGINSLTRIAAERGVDLEEVLLERALEEQLARELGVSVTTDFSAGGQRQNRDAGDGATSARVDVLRAMVQDRFRRTRIAALIEAGSLNGNGRHG